MSIYEVTDADIKSVLEIDNLDDALFPLQEIAKVESGDVAGMVFSGYEDQYVEWHNGAPEKREAMIRHWIDTEKLYA